VTEAERVERYVELCLRLLHLDPSDPDAVALNEECAVLWSQMSDEARGHAMGRILVGMSGE